MAAVGAAGTGVACGLDGGEVGAAGGDVGPGVDVATGSKVDVGGARVGGGSTGVAAGVDVNPSIALAAVLGWPNKNVRKSTIAIAR